MRLLERAFRDLEQTERTVCYSVSAMTNLVSETQTVVMATIRIIDVINGKVDSKLGLIMQPICREIKSVSAGISGVEVNVTGVKVH